MQRKQLALTGCALSAVLMWSACTAGSSGPNPAATSFAQGDTILVAGLLIDSRCYGLDQANTGRDHMRPEGEVKACAAACASAGFPAAVLVDGDPDDTVWVLVTIPQMLADYMAESVRVRGIVRSAGVLIPERVEYLNGDTWTMIM